MPEPTVCDHCGAEIPFGTTGWDVCCCPACLQEMAEDEDWDSFDE